MSAEAVSPISTYFRVCDGVRVRFADTRADSDITVLLLAPWPESLWAFRRIWGRVSGVGRVVAIDLPGFGHSDGRRSRRRPWRRGGHRGRESSGRPCRQGTPAPGRARLLGASWRGR